jgi:penicillin-binding protein 1C
MAWLHRAVPSPPPFPPAGVVSRPVKLPRQVEPDRVEWFLTGTEPQAEAEPLAAAHPRIVSPVEGTIIALDPDIPPLRQRVVFEAHAIGTPVRWVLDGTALGSARDLVFWNPHPGRHTLSLVDDGRLLDTLTFEVRGEVIAAQH